MTLDRCPNGQGGEPVCSNSGILETSSGNVCPIMLDDLHFGSWILYRKYFSFSFWFLAWEIDQKSRCLLCVCTTGMNRLNDQALIARDVQMKSHDSKHYGAHHYVSIRFSNCKQAMEV